MRKRAERRRCQEYVVVRRIPASLSMLGPAVWLAAFTHTAAHETSLAASQAYRCPVSLIALVDSWLEAGQLCGVSSLRNLAEVDSH
jgi:hypothetical protein